MISGTISEYTNKDSLEKFIICQNPDCQELHENIPLKTYTIKPKNEKVLIIIERKEIETGFLIDYHGFKYYEANEKVYILYKNKDDICIGECVIEESENELYCNNCNTLIYRECNEDIEKEVSNIFDKSTGDDLSKIFNKNIKKVEKKEKNNDKVKIKKKEQVKNIVPKRK